MRDEAAQRGFSAFICSYVCNVLRIGGVDYEIPPDRGAKPLTCIQEAAEVGVETAGIC